MPIFLLGDYIFIYSIEVLEAFYLKNKPNQTKPKPN